jgi:hypothetical protein
MRCDLCASEEAVENGLLCGTCLEAIHRLQAIVAAGGLPDNAEPLTTDAGFSEEGLSSHTAKPGTSV